jgi:hypothetical protein
MIQNINNVTKISSDKDKNKTTATFYNIINLKNYRDNYTNLKTEAINNLVGKICRYSTLFCTNDKNPNTNCDTANFNPSDFELNKIIGVDNKMCYNDTKYLRLESFGHYPSQSNNPSFHLAHDSILCLKKMGLYRFVLEDTYMIFILYYYHTRKYAKYKSTHPKIIMTILEEIFFYLNNTVFLFDSSKINKKSGEEPKITDVCNITDFLSTSCNI